MIAGAPSPVPLQHLEAVGESTMGAVIADAQLAATQAADRGGAQLALMNPGGIRTDILMAQAAGGEQPGERARVAAPSTSTPSRAT